MGTDKAVLRRGDSTQLAHIVELVGGVTERVFVSVRATQADDTERAQFDCIVDSVDVGGPVAGILSAMAAHPGVDWLVVACDLPNVDTATLSYLIEEHAAGTPFTAYRSSHDDLPEPLCAIYTAGSRDRLQAFVADGLHCPRKMLLRSDTRLLQQPRPDALDNVNTPADLSQSVLEASG